MSPAWRRLRWATSPGRSSPRAAAVFIQAGSASVVETTTFGIAFILAPNSPVVSSMAGHAAANPS